MINNQDYKIADKEISLLSLNFKEGENKDESIIEILAQSKKIMKKYFKIIIFNNKPDTKRW